jgi:hypothetical protein
MLYHNGGITLYTPLVKSRLYQAALLPVKITVGRQQSVSKDPAQVLIELAAGEDSGLVDQKVAHMVRSKEQHDRRAAHMNRRQPAERALDATDEG